jgi:spore germination protein YaaH
MMENFKQCNGHIHVIEKGDTLYKLAKRFDCNLSDIIAANPYVNVYNMQVGEEVCIPIQLPEEVEEEGYVVVEGDTFDKVLKNFGICPDMLFQLNPELYKVELPVGMNIVGSK